MEGNSLSYLSTVLMGILQGITEFLPISSSGHLALYQHFFGGEGLAENQLFFSVMLHFGTLISVFIYYWKDIVDMIREFFLMLGALFTSHSGKRESSQVPPARRMVLLVIVATLPLFAVLPVKDLIETATGNVFFVSAALIVTGFLLFFSDRFAKGKKNARTATVGDALLVGCAQAVGTLPGISRSGMTISAGMLRGYERSFAVRFSFIMSLPAVFGATILELKEALETGLDLALLPYCLVGMVVSAVVGYFAIRLVNLLAEKGKFGAFAYYCWAVGLVALVAGLFV